LFIRRVLLALFALNALGCAGRPQRAPSTPEPCTLERALGEQEPDLRTVEELCPTHPRRTSEATESSPTPEGLSLSHSLLTQLCDVNEEQPLTCVAARSPAYADLEENSASFVLHGAFTKLGARQALLAVGPLSVLFEWAGSEFAPRAVLPDLELDFSGCFVVAPVAHVQQVACFQRAIPRRSGGKPQTFLDVHDLESMRTTRLFSFSDTFLSSCGNVDASRLLDLVPDEISATQHQSAPNSLSLHASYLIAEKPAAYDRSCLDLLQRNFEMGAPVGDTAALLCAFPQYSAAEFEFVFASGAWQAASDTQEVLDKLEVDGSWYRSIEVQPTPSRSAPRTPH